MHKSPAADLRRSHRLRAQLGWCLALALLLVAFSLPTSPTSITAPAEVFDDAIVLDHPPATLHRVRVPLPTPPLVPLPVPDDTPLDTPVLEFDIEIDPAQGVAPGPPPTHTPEPDENDEPDFILIPEVAPELIGGLAALAERLTYPALARRAGVEGTVWVEFIVDTDGHVVDPVVVKGIGAGCDEAALEAVRGVRFRPGKQRGRPVKTRFTLPVRFRLR